MQINELIEKISRLPAYRQQEVLDFVSFLELRSQQNQAVNQGEWSANQFKDMSVDQAMRGLEGEDELYTENDLRERWQ